MHEDTTWGITVELLGRMPTYDHARDAKRYEAAHEQFGKWTGVPRGPYFQIGFLRENCPMPNPAEFVELAEGIGSALDVKPGRLSKITITTLTRMAADNKAAGWPPPVIGTETP